ncbi:MAG: hypothetical protein QOJ89_86 [bacterium]
MPTGRELAQRRDDRRVRDVAAAEAEAGALEHEHAVRAGAARELAHEPALADAGLARDDRQAGHAFGCAPQRRAQRRELGVTPDERAARDAPPAGGERAGARELGARRIRLGCGARRRREAWGRGRRRRGGGWRRAGRQAARRRGGGWRRAGRQDGRRRGPRRRAAERLRGLERELAGGRLARGRILRQRASEDRVERVQLRRDMRQLGRRGVQVRPHARCRRVALERHAAAEHPKQDAAEGVDVGRGADGVAADLLGRRVVGAADPLVGARRAVARRCQPRQAEVRQERAVAGADEDVRRLDVAVHEADRMCRAERVGDLREDRDDAPRRQALGRHKLAQVGPLDEAHRDERHAVAVAGVVDGDDVRVIEHRGDARLVLEAPPRLVVAEQRGRDDLQRDGPLQRQLRRAVDGPHAAAAGERVDAVAGEGRSDVQAGGERRGGGGDGGHAASVSAHPRRLCVGSVTRPVDPSQTLHAKRRAPITARRRPRISMAQRATFDPASLPAGAGIPAFHAQRSREIHYSTSVRMKRVTLMPTIATSHAAVTPIACRTFGSASSRCAMLLPEICVMSCTTPVESE